MALIDSNTFVEPTAATTLATARTQFNNSLRSLLTNFSGDGSTSSAPSQTSGNITRDGAATSIENGMLYRHSNTLVTAFYVSDSVNKKTAVVGGNFTRVGIGTQIVEGGIAGLMNKMQHFEVGELISTVTDAGGDLESNGRLYMKLSNGTAATDLIDVGIPPTQVPTLVNAMFFDTTKTGTGSTSSGIFGSKLNFNHGASKGEGGPNAHIQVSAAAGEHSAIALGVVNTANTSIVHWGSADATRSLRGKDGLNILTEDTTKYGNLAVQSVSVATVTRVGAVGGTDVAPLCPAGTVIMWAGQDTAIPPGYLLCNGQSVERAVHPALFNALGTSYGSASGTHFNVPDFRDRIPTGKGSTITRTFTASKTIGGSASVPTLTATGQAATVVHSSSTPVALGTKDTSGTAIGTLDITANVPDLTVQLPSCGINFLIKT